MLKNIKHWKTSLVGIITIVIFGLTSFNVVTAEQGEAVKVALDTIIEAAGGDAMGLIAALATGVVAVFPLFAKDPDKKVKKE